jgi:hypothetical protein
VDEEVHTLSRKVNKYKPLACGGCTQEAGAMALLVIGILNVVEACYQAETYTRPLFSST